MHELNIKDVFRTERLRQMGSNANDHTPSSRTRTEKTSLKAGMEALMQELLGHTKNQENDEHQTIERDPDITLH